MHEGSLSNARIPPGHPEGYLEAFALSKEGFSTNLLTLFPSAWIYPYPVTGEWGFIPNVTNLSWRANLQASFIFFLNNYIKLK